MDIKYFINICLIILVLHIILLNINFNIKIGNKSNLENFDNNMNNSGAATIDFLKNDSNDDFKKRLLNYIQQNGIKHGIDYLNKIIPNLNNYELYPQIVFSV